MVEAGTAGGRITYAQAGEMRKVPGKVMVIGLWSDASPPESGQIQVRKIFEGRKGTYLL